MKGLVNSVAYADGLRVGEVAIPDISEVLKQPGRFVWVGLHEPDAEMLAEIQQEFSLHAWRSRTPPSPTSGRSSSGTASRSLSSCVPPTSIPRPAGSTTARRTSSSG